MLKGERFSVEGGETQCRSVIFPFFLKIIFRKTIATISFIKPIENGKY